MSAGGNGALVINGLSQSIHHAANHAFAGWNGHDLPGAPYFIPFADFGVFAQQHGADLVFFQVHGETRHTVTEVEQFTGHDFVQAVNAGNTVAQ